MLTVVCEGHAILPAKFRQGPHVGEHIGPLLSRPILRLPGVTQLLVVAILYGKIVKRKSKNLLSRFRAFRAALFSAAVVAQGCWHHCHIVLSTRRTERQSRSRVRVALSCENTKMTPEGFTEELRLQVAAWTWGQGLAGRQTDSKSEVLLQVPCRMPTGSITPSQEAWVQLAPVLRAHEACVASQKALLDAAALEATFQPLLRVVKELQGVHADKIDLSPQNSQLEDTHLLTLPEDLLRLKGQVTDLRVVSAKLDSLPEWLGDLEKLGVLHIAGNINFDSASLLR